MRYLFIAAPFVLLTVVIPSHRGFSTTFWQTEKSCNSFVQLRLTSRTFLTSSFERLRRPHLQTDRRIGQRGYLVVRISSAIGGV
jgi:hypothetical protein